MKKIFLLTVLFCSVVLTPAQAQENWTEIGIYGFLTQIEGPVRINNVKVDLDISFNDILDNLDMGFMGFVEHRRGRWSFIGDVAYLDVSSVKHRVRNRITSTTLDVKASEVMAEGFIGYRVLEQDHGDAQFGLDLLGGARYNKLEVELDDRAFFLGLTSSSDRNPERDWVDGVVALRAEYVHNNGWGVHGWADIGNGSDSSSYQLFGIVSYRFKNKISIRCGYRLYSYEFSGRSRGIKFKADLDYPGPMIGVSYRF